MTDEGDQKGTLAKLLGTDPRRHLAAVAVLVALATLPLIGIGSLPFDNDCLYGDVIRDVREMGHWMTPEVHGVPFIDKPPLHFWLGAVITGVLGDNEFSLRLPAALAAIVAAMMTFMLARELVGRGAKVLMPGREQDAPGAALLAGWLAVASLLIVSIFVQYSLRNYMEVQVAACAVGSLWLLMRTIDRHGNEALVYGALAGFAVGLGIMFKSVVGLVGVAGFVTWMLVGGRWVQLLKPGVLVAAGVALIVAAPWHAWQLANNTDVFMDFQWKLHVQEQFLEPQPWSAGGPLFYLEQILGTEKPLLAVLVPSGTLAIWRVAGIVRRALKSDDQGETLGNSPVVAAACFALVPVVFFSISETKKDLYMVAFAPMLAVFVSVGISALLCRVNEKVRRIGYLGAVGACGGLFLIANLPNLDPSGPVLDGAPDQKVIGEALADDSADVEGDVSVHLMGIMPVVIQYYSGHEAVMWTVDEQYHRDVMRIPYIRYAENVRLGGYMDVRRVMQLQERFYGVANRGGLLHLARGKDDVHIVAHSGDFVLFRNFGKGEADEAVSIADLEKQGAIPEWPVEAILLSAAEMRMQGRFSEAVDEYKVAVDAMLAGPKRIDAIRDLGETLYWLDRRDEAAAVLGDLRPHQAGRRSWEMLADLAWLACRDGDPGLEMLFRELVSSPGEPLPLRMLGSGGHGCGDEPTPPLHDDLRARALEGFEFADSVTVGSDVAVAVVLDDPSVASGSGYIPEILRTAGFGSVAALTPDDAGDVPASTVLIWASSASPPKRDGLVYVGDRDEVISGPWVSRMTVVGEDERPFRLPVAVSEVAAVGGAKRLAGVGPKSVATVGPGAEANIGFDLGAAVVKLRQGDPALADRDTDGISGVTPIDLFGDTLDASDWSVQRADLLVELLASAVKAVSAHPLPTLGLLPPGVGGVVVLTGDQDFSDGAYAEAMASEVKTATGGTGSMTFYLTSGTQQREFRAGANLITDPEYDLATELLAAGHELAPHTNLTPFLGSDEVVTAMVGAHFDHIVRAYGVAPVTARNHRISWVGYATMARTYEQLGILMDLNFAGLMTKRSPGPGYLNGSTLPMRMVDDDGRLMAIFQQSTHLSDDGFPSASIKSLGMEIKDEALEPPDFPTLTVQSLEFVQNASSRGYPVVLSHHPIHFAKHPSWLRGILELCTKTSIVVWPAASWLDFWVNRYATRFTDVTFTGGLLGFTVTGQGGSQARNVVVNLPVSHDGMKLTSLVVAGQPVALSPSAGQVSFVVAHGQRVEATYGSS